VPQEKIDVGLDMEITMARKWMTLGREFAQAISFSRNFYLIVEVL
jgi:hypothetical protein